MDQEQKALIVQSQDPAIAARVIRNIVNVERDWHLANGLLSERFMREVCAFLAKLTPENWKLFEEGWSALFVPLEWKQKIGVGKGDAWLELAELCDAEEEYSWIAVAAGVGPTQMGLELVFRNGLLPVAQALLESDQGSEALLKLGFIRDATKERLFIPIKINTGLLAQGFEENDFDKALAPISAAVAVAVKGKADLDKIVDLVREAAKRR